MNDYFYVTVIFTDICYIKNHQLSNSIPIYSVKKVVLFLWNLDGGSGVKNLPWNAGV